MKASEAEFSSEISSLKSSLKVVFILKRTCQTIKFNERSKLSGGAKRYILDKTNKEQGFIDVYSPAQAVLWKPSSFVYCRSDKTNNSVESWTEPFTFMEE